MSVDTITHLVLTYRYWILIPLSFIEGPMIAFVTGTLSWLGYFNPYVAFTVFFFRDVVLDGFFYFLGRYGGNSKLGRRLLARIKVKEEHLTEVHTLWEKHGFRTMFFSKLSYGLSALFLVVAGIVDFSMRKFFIYAAVVALLQYGVLFILGYYFGNAFGTVSSIVSNLQYVVAGVVIITMGYYLFTRYMRKRLLKQEKEAEVEKEKDNISL